MQTMALPSGAKRAQLAVFSVTLITITDICEFMYVIDGRQVTQHDR